MESRIIFLDLAYLLVVLLFTFNAYCTLQMILFYFFVHKSWCKHVELFPAHRLQFMREIMFYKIVISIVCFSIIVEYKFI